MIEFQSPQFVTQSSFDDGSSKGHDGGDDEHDGIWRTHNNNKYGINHNHIQNGPFSHSDNAASASSSTKRVESSILPSCTVFDSNSAHGPRPNNNNNNNNNPSSQPTVTLFRQAYDDVGDDDDDDRQGGESVRQNEFHGTITTSMVSSSDRLDETSLSQKELPNNKKQQSSSTNNALQAMLDLCQLEPAPQSQQQQQQSGSSGGGGSSSVDEIAKALGMSVLAAANAIAERKNQKNKVANSGGSF